MLLPEYPNFKSPPGFVNQPLPKRVVIRAQLTFLQGGSGVDARCFFARYEKMEREGTDTAITDMPPVLESPVHAPDALHKMLTPPPTPPKIPATSGPTVDDRLQKLADLFGKKLISQAEYDAKRQQILGEL